MCFYTGFDGEEGILTALSQTIPGGMRERWNDATHVHGLSGRAEGMERDAHTI
jgi:hypothetical protein